MFGAHLGVKKSIFVNILEKIGIFTIVQRLAGFNFGFYNPISRATLLELEILVAGGFGGSLIYLGVKKSF